MAHMTDEDCPFHDLPPGQTVHVEVSGYSFPYSAEYACSEYHFAAAMQPTMDAGLAAARAWMDSLAPPAELPTCYRRTP